MNESEFFYLCLAVWAITYGVSVFVPERTLVVVSAVAAVITGVLAVTLAF